MKYQLFVALWAFGLLSSCDNALMEAPRNFMNPDQFFNSDAEAIQAVNGAYSTCYFLYGSGGTNDIGYWSALGTDIGIPNVGDQSDISFLIYTLNPNNNNGLADVWRNLYKGVANCNMVIAKVTGNEKLSEAVRNQVLGQAHFLRGLYYHWLTCFWGDVPMWLEPLNVTEISGPLKRIPVAEVRQQIVKDLEVASSNLPAEWTGNNLGRVSKWAALILMGQVHLWQEDWTSAANVAKQVIDNRSNGGKHVLLDDYGDLWGVKNEYNAENIWEIDFMVNVHSQSFTDRYVPNQNYDVEVPGYEGMFTGYALITSTPEFLATFEADDLREKWYNWNGSNGVKTKFHYIAKNIEWGEARNNHGLNCMVFRLANAYLIHAEAANEATGPTVEAYESLNAIRNRAGLESLAGLSKEAFREATRMEILHEVSFEYNRRWDLNRWGLLVEAMKGIAATNPTGARNVQPHHNLCPIPTQEIALNPELTQNPGY